MFKKILAASLVAGLSATAIAADTYTADVRHLYPVFEINHFGMSTQRGRFNKATARITIDAAAKTGSVEATVDTTSLDMGADDWDKHIKSEDFFNVEKYPTMSFKSDKFSFDGDKLVTVDGALTMLGVTKPVKLSIANFKCGAHPMNKKPVCTGDVSTTINRTDWGMTKYAPALAEQVKIEIPVEAFKD